MSERALTVGSWNLNWRVGDAALRQGRLLANHGVELVALQETNPRSLEALCHSAGFTWMRSSLALRSPHPDEGQRRRRGTAIAGTGEEPRAYWLVEGVPVAERTIVCDFGDFLAGSFHAPPGVTWGIVKAHQAVRIARYLAAVEQPVLFGIDANTPKVDHPDFALTRTHWHTGYRRLEGEDGDDLLVGPTRVHGLMDTYRTWLEANPAELEVIRTSRPEGPLAISHRTGKRKNSPGTARRYDAVWASDHFRVDKVSYHYDEGVEAGSDHALVTAHLRLESEPRVERSRDHPVAAE